MKFPKVHTVAFGIKTPEERSMAISIFQNARTLIDSGKEHWTCLAIGVVSNPVHIEHRGDFGQTRQTHIIGDVLIDEIDRRLGDEAFVTSWLQNEMGDDAYSEKTFTSREYRLAWIDSMIEELQ